jgi:TRAP-type C4-dicarboxylate transport system substrate-binding protein
MITTAEATSVAFDEFADKHLVEAEYTDTHPLMFHVAARMKFHMRNVPITKVEDFRGRKVRATHKAMGDSLQAYGATALFMPVPQVPQSLQRGVIDGAVLPWEVVVPLKVYELVEYHSLIEGGRGFMVPAFVLTVNKRVFDGLPAAQKAALETATNRDFVRKVGAAYDQEEQVGAKLARDRGNKFNVLSDDVVKQMVALTDPVRDAWVKDVTAKGHNGKALMDEANGLIDRYTGR